MWVPPEYKTSPATFRLTLANIELKLGNLNEAKSIVIEARDLLQSKLGSENHPDVIRVDMAFAHICTQRGEYRQAAEYSEKVLSANKSFYGVEHPKVAYAQNNLALIYDKLGQDKEAEQLYLESLEIRRKILGMQHPDVATPLNNLSLLFARQKRYAEAEIFLRDALSIRESNLSENDPVLAETIRNLAILCIPLEKYEEALFLLKKSIDLEDKQMRQRVRNATEAEKFLAYQLIGRSYDMLVSLVYRHLLHSEQAVNAALESIIQRKGLVSESTARDFSHREIGQNKIDEFANITASLASLAVGGPKYMPLGMYCNVFNKAMEKMDSLERSISASQLETSQQFSTATSITEQIQRLLSDDEVLIEYVACSIFDFSDLNWEGQKNDHPEHYFAFVIKGGAHRHSTFIDLGECNEINTLIHQFSSEFEIMSIRSISPEYERNAETYLAAIGKDIYRRLIEPLKQDIDTSRRVSIVPDGQLATFPIAALQNTEGQYLIA